MKPVLTMDKEESVTSGLLGLKEVPQYTFIYNRISPRQDV